MTAADPTLLAALSDTHVIALTLYGEARGEAIEGRFAVANIILNRAFVNNPIFGRTLRGVCLKPAQFSCWAPKDGAANFSLVVETAKNLTQPDPPIGPVLKECLWIAAGAVGGQFTDNTHGGLYYMTTEKLRTDPPRWVAGLKPTAVIGRHSFFREA